MKIQSRLTTSILTSFVVSLVIASAAIVTLHGVRRDIERSQVYDEIIFKSSALNILLAGLKQDEFPSDLQQMLALSASLEKLLETVKGVDSEEASLISHVQEDSKELARLLNSAVIRAPGDNIYLDPERKTLIEPQLWIKIRRISDESGRLRVISRNRILSAQDKASLTILLLLLALMASNTLISIFSGKAILQSEESLRESETRYRTIFKDAHDGMAVVDMQSGLIVNCNKALCSLVGRSRDDILGNSPTILHPAMELLRSDTSGNHEPKELVFGVAINHELLTSSGKLIPVDVMCSTFQMAGQSYLLAVFRDIALRKKIESELIDSEKKYRALVESSSEAILVFQSGKLEFFNRKARILFGSALAKLQSGTLIDHTHQDDRERLSAFLTSAQNRSRGITGDFTFRIVVGSGRIHWIELSITPIEWEEKPAQLFFMKDISETRRLEEQLQQAQKLESIGSLAGGVAHDFNNMLTIILGYGEAVCNRMDAEDPNREYMLEIINAGNRSAALTRQLLAFSRRQAMQPKPINLNRVILDLDKMLRRLIGEDIHLKLLLGDQLEMVLADPSQIEQIIVNLAVNARDSMPSGGKLHIETSNASLDDAYSFEHNEVEPGQYVCLAVTDSGSGMTREVLRQIFDPFFTTKEKGRGTGLGLSTVYGIVKQSGGHIWAYSEPGKGTTIKIYLPQTDLDPDKTERNLRKIEGTTNNEHILVVEDEKSLRDLIVALLASLKYKVSVARDGIEALRIIEEDGREPDLILTDVIMPGMSGTELVNQVRAKYPDIRALYMSGYTDNAAIEGGILKAGMPFIQKPFSINDLSEKVRELLLQDKNAPSD